MVVFIIDSLPFPASLNDIRYALEIAVLIFPTKEFRRYDEIFYL
jgi:hypothetical protein